jgi:hypothetical protein
MYDLLRYTSNTDHKHNNKVENDVHKCTPQSWAVCLSVNNKKFNIKQSSEYSCTSYSFVKLLYIYKCVFKRKIYKHFVVYNIYYYDILSDTFIPIIIRCFKTHTCLCKLYIKKRKIKINTTVYVYYI